MKNFECVCGMTNAFQDPYHALVCKETRYLGYHSRHNQIITNMAEYIRRLGFHISVELNNTSEKDRKRTDIVVIIGQYILMIDVTCREPLTRTRAKAIANISTCRNCNDIEATVDIDGDRMYNSVLRRAEKEKWEKYQELCGNYQAQFFTAAVESTGGIGKEFRYIINLIGENAVSIASGYETGEVVGVLHSSVAVAVQNGCGRIIRDNRIQVIRRNLFKEKSIAAIAEDNLQTQQRTNHKPLEQETGGKRSTHRETTRELRNDVSDFADNDRLIVNLTAASCIDD